MKRIITLAMAVLAMAPAAMAQKKGAEKKDAPQKVEIVAHRGYWDCEEGQGAKNSIASLKAAQKYGFWGSEFDVNMTKDGVLLVYHDGSINVNGEKKKINSYNYDTFKDVRLVNGEPIPTLQDYLDQAKKSPKTKMVLEIKKHATPEMERECVDRIIETLKANGYFKPEKTIFISFSLNVCQYLTKVAPEFTNQYLDTDIDPNQVASYGINGVDTDYKTVLKDDQWVKDAKGHDMSVNTWTVDKKDDMKSVINLGVDQVTTNKPEDTRAVLKSMGLKEQKKTRK